MNRKPQVSLTVRDTDRALDRREQHTLLARLLEKIDRSVAKRSNRRWNVAVRGEEDRGYSIPALPNRGLKRESVDLGQTKVDKKCVERQRIEAVQNCRARQKGRHVVSRDGKHAGQCAKHCGVIV